LAADVNSLLIAGRPWLLYRLYTRQASPRRIMDRDVADGFLIDVRGIDIANLLAEPAGASVGTALDWLLTSSTDRCNDFNSYI
jgi:hypothetical protein